MASLSRVFIEAIKDSLDKNPLARDEVRKIKCLGSYYISLAKQVREYEPIAHIRAGEQDVYLYRILDQ